MNVNTGELFKIRNEVELKELQKAFGEVLKPVPDELVGQADQELGDKDRVFIDMDKETPLVRWEKSKQSDKKKKTKRKMAKRSRKRNR